MERDRLLRQLLGAHGVRLVLLTAPAGYGKTALLQAWERRDPRPFRWLLGGPGGGARRAAELATITAAPERVTGPCVLVVDAGAGADGVPLAERLGPLAAALPDDCVLVVASRGEPGIAAGRLRAQGEVLQLGARDLALTAGEAAATLETAGARLGARAREQLLRRTEGWPAAVSLAAQAGDGDALADYVREEVLDALPAGLRRFARRCSVLEALDAERCDAMLETTGSAASLFALARSPLPLARPGAAGTLRCHPLVRQALLAELQRCEPAAEHALHRRASRWFAEHGDLEQAVDHALAARDLDHAGVLMWQAAQRAAWDGRQTVLDHWLGEVPAPALERHDGLALAAAMTAFSQLDVAEAERRLAAPTVVPRSAPAATRASLTAGRAVLTAALGGSAGAGALRDRAVAAAHLAPGAEPVRALAALLEGAGAALAGDTVSACSALEHGARLAAATAPGLAALCQAQLALVALGDADTEHGAALAERARARAEAVGVDEHPALALVVAVSAYARAHRGRFAEARADAERAERLAPARDELPPWYGAQLSLALARARARLSEVDAAHALLAEARRALRRLPGAHGLEAWVADAAAPACGPATTAEAPAEALTAAELRVLRFLPSHLSFREIGGCLHVSANTIKSQAHAVYRKLGASSRSVAVQRAWALGLLDAAEPRSPGSGDVAGLSRA